MEKRNAEKVKKALECCSSSDGVSACESGCPYWGGDYDTCPCIEEPNFIIKNALALINTQEQEIKELTEENEGLRDENSTLMADRLVANIEVIMCKRKLEALDHRYDRVKADTVSEIRAKVAVHFGTYTDKDQVKIAYVFMLLDQIAKEMLEGENEN